jgi:hypothetical protein
VSQEHVPFKHTPFKLQSSSVLHPDAFDWASITRVSSTILERDMQKPLKQRGAFSQAVF